MLKWVAVKTTLINALCRQLGVTEHTSSPTFSIINEYRTDQDQVFIMLTGID
ncbi:MAG: tRNA (adenosine(37)-N6)-threonylcarbamoyltransferase complex ATPase subunit type 1 TsaE [Bacteroidetes bacterium]|nr:tRNA (adenosine(37)-N6)-threonylcarbamoyltransferase complex ATPase subunit type 1 TsaE [Bacteroidota bacterium]